MNQRVKYFSQDKYQVELPVEPEHHNMRLDQFIQLYMNSFSREIIKKKIQKGEVSIQDRPGKHRPSTRLKNKEKVIITTYNNEEEKTWKGKPLEFQDEPQVIFKDEDIVVAYKPPFMSTHPTGKHLFNCLTIWLEHELESPVYNVHRLDRETSGILVLGRNVPASNKLTRSFEDKKVSKGYFFIAKKLKEVSFPLIAKERLGLKAHFSPSMYTHCFPEDSRNGKQAETHFYEVQSEQDYVLGIAFPITGRQHQIRAHAAYHGLPLLGDKMYSGDIELFGRDKEGMLTDHDYRLLEIPRHALHAMGLYLPHPKNGTYSLFHGEIPADLTHWITTKTKIDTSQLLKSCKEILEKKLKVIKDNNT